jgi:lysophospholipase L1-like esterase
MATRKTFNTFTSHILALIYCCSISICFATTANGANIIAFGDSITRGYGSNSGGYPPKLSDLLNSNGKPSIVGNFGIDGESTYEGLQRFDSVLGSFAANLILIQEGTNDIHNGMSVQTTQWNLQGMIDKAKAAGVTPLLSTLTPETSVVPEVWNPMISALASSNGITLVDNYAATAAIWGSISSDNIHPTDEGYQIMANTWYATLSGMISSSGEVSSGGGGGGGGGCFIATAAFGSPTEKHVMLLRDFRDTCLLTNAPGRQFVDMYYRYSPAAADFIRQHENIKFMVRVLLYPLITLSYVLLKLAWPVQLGLALILAASCLALPLFARRQRAA